MRKKRSLIILAVVLALLIGAYVYLSNRPEEEEPPAETEPVIDISRFDRETIKKVILTNGSEEIAFESRQEEVVIEKTPEQQAAEGEDKKEPETKIETVWYNTKPYPVELDQTKVVDLTRTFASLSAEVVVEEEPKDLSIYGLKDPEVTGTAELEDGTKVVLHLGNKTAEGNTYYLMKEGDPKVYTVWSNHGNRLSSSLSDFRKTSLTQIDLVDMKYLLIQREGQRDMEVKPNDELSETQAQYGLSFFRFYKPFKSPRGVDSSKLDPKLQEAVNMVIKEFVDDNPEDLSKYGLDQPKAHFVLKDSKNTLDLYFGNTNDDGTIYFKTADSDSVYKMDKSLTEFMNFKPMDVMEKFALLVNIEDVDKVVIEGRGQTHTLSITRKTEKAEKEGEKDKVIANYFLDGKEKDEDPFKDFYQSLIGILVDTEKPHTAEGSADVKITYHMNKGPQSELTVEFYPFDRDFYSVVRDGDKDSEFLAARNRLDWVFEDLGELEASEFEGE